MHQSRVYALLIDTPEAEAAPAAAFWSAALGATARPVPEEPQFTRLQQALPGLATIVQAVDDAPRFHLDIETDDVEAETARLRALGSRSRHLVVKSMIETLRLCHRRRSVNRIDHDLYFKLKLAE